MNWDFCDVHMAESLLTGFVFSFHYVVGRDFVFGNFKLKPKNLFLNLGFPSRAVIRVCNKTSCKRCGHRGIRVCPQSLMIMMMKLASDNLRCSCSAVFLFLYLFTLAVTCEFLLFIVYVRVRCENCVFFKQIHIQ